MNKREQDRPWGRGKSTIGKFQALARERVARDLEQLGVAPGNLSFKVPADFVSPRREDSVMVSYSFPSGRKKRGAPIKPETLRVIEAEAARLAGGARESKRAVAQRFFAQLAPAERYGKYRGIVKDHAEKIQELLRKLRS
jgi:hypothetical protein